MRAMRTSVVKVPTCQQTKSVPKFHFHVPMCQRANVPSAKDVSIFKLACKQAKKRAKFSTIFQKKIFSNF